MLICSVAQCYGILCYLLDVRNLCLEAEGKYGHVADIDDRRCVGAPL